MRNLLAVLALMLAFALGGLVVWHFTQRHPAVPDAPALILKIREVARLESLDVSLYKKIDFRPDPREEKTMWGAVAQWAAYSVRPPRGRAIVFAVAHLGVDLQIPRVVLQPVPQLVAYGVIRKRFQVRGGLRKARQARKLAHRGHERL